ncbi:hypothetical protein C8J57DRAFT_1283813 [Mycena rebaudengoi]|nr:hypothetical protein C8J57DRAFT_1283813 [Mycena rebaudengoi]
MQCYSFSHIPNNRQFSAQDDTPQHCLLDYLKGVASTNAFSCEVDSVGNHAGMILLAGSLFNHSDKPNVRRTFDFATCKMVFKTVSSVKEGEELMVDYLEGNVLERSRILRDIS